MNDNVGMHPGASAIAPNGASATAPMKILNPFGRTRMHQGASLQKIIPDHDK